MKSKIKKKEFNQREDVKTMGEWPSEDCVKVLDETIVIKLGTEGDE